jgi:acetyl-CoA acetyltransferase
MASAGLNLPQVEIAGVGMHPFGRYSDRSLKDLARVAVARALTDAGMGVKDLQAVYCANGMAGLLQGQEMVRGQSTLRDVGIEQIPIVNIENACAGGSSALREAIMAIRAGAADVALAVGFEKMFVEDRDRSLNALETAADIELTAGLGLQFTAIYAMRLRKRLDAGLLEMSDLVDVAVKSHHNGSLNPNAQHQSAMTAEEVAGSRLIADPLTLLMCSSFSDGAAAVIVRRAAPPQQGARPVIRVRASAATSGFTSDPTREDLPSAAARCAQIAYAEAGVSPNEIDVAEVHDAMAPGELIYYEELGFCEPGGAGELLRSGATSLTGSLPVNPSGGLTSRGHPVGATGLGQVAELVWQLRGEAGARQVRRPMMALAQNSGGWMSGESAACNVHILERTSRWT